MRSRRDDLDTSVAIDRALVRGVVGMGEASDARAERRLERFIGVPVGAFVWTRDARDHVFLGRLTGPWRRDDADADVDLVNVRDCDWIAEPVDPALQPAAVAQTFARGGRGFQQIHPGDVEAQTARVWERLSS